MYHCESIAKGNKKAHHRNGELVLLIITAV